MSERTARVPMLGQFGVGQQVVELIKVVAGRYTHQHGVMYADEVWVTEHHITRT